MQQCLQHLSPFSLGPLLPLNHQQCDDTENICQLAHYLIPNLQKSEFPNRLLLRYLHLCSHSYNCLHSAETYIS